MRSPSFRSGSRFFAICAAGFQARRTRRQSQRPWLSRSVLRAARLAPATVVAHLERSAKMPKAFATIAESEKEVWLVQHVPHRICAALTWLDMRGAWTMPKPPDMPKTGDFHVWCLNRSVEE